MTLLVWILLGLIAGFIASHIVDHPSEGIVLDVLLGIIGAFVGGWLFPAFGHTAVTGLNLHSVLVAAVGPSSYCLSIMRWAGNDGIAAEVSQVMGIVYDKCAMPTISITSTLALRLLFLKTR